ncbi:GNAT family N-acetyltransferase [Streptomyces sp. NRRL S-87]|uniref:GNAT family N-acetyltransferase n=1 Tax=Streptomyces sp. NRRL S-87 TaxID=1463920 RepID=UPI0004BF7E63|nr:GNAT family N-acetyltransferase [Streptomyces sp. NRRL S-87]
MTVEIRTITESDVKDWARTTLTGFLTPAVPTDDDVAQRVKYAGLDRCQGAYDTHSGRCVATFRSFAQRLTVPGGASIPTTAVSGVVVAPTHRRRGILSRMMAADLAAARERGEVAATLIAAEYPIYGRYGFAPATSLCEWEIDTLRAGLDRRWAGPQDGGRVDLAEAAEVREIGPQLHERLRARRPGVIDRDERWWKLATGLESVSWRPYKERFHAVYRSADGEPEGLAVYAPADEKWTDAKTPDQSLAVHDLIAVTPAAERALWHFLCSIDWVRRVRTGYRAPDDLVPDLLPNRRAASIVTSADWLWVRLLDVVRALEARTYEHPGVLVLEVADPDGPAGGRYRLDATGERPVCVPTDGAPDLRLGIAELSALYLGDVSAARLALLGRISEERPGAAALADDVFRTALRPWCPDLF